MQAGEILSVHETDRAALIVENDDVIFGGNLTFSPPWWPSDQCLSNCSFVSGEVSGATATAIALLLVAGLWRDRLSPLAARAITVLEAGSDTSFSEAVGAAADAVLLAGVIAAIAVVDAQNQEAVL